MTMTILQSFVSELSDDEKKEIIKGYDKWCDAGEIGNELIRIKARLYIQKVGLRMDSITNSMKDLAFECNHYFAAKYLETLNKTVDT